LESEAHYNKVTDEYVGAPHVHDPATPGGVRPAAKYEIPGNPIPEL